MRIALASGGQRQAGARTFRSPAALAVWWVWLAFAVANLIDLAVQGRDHVSAVAAAVLVLITAVVYVTALRPRVVADDAGLTVVNPLRGHRIGWASVAKVDVAELLRVHCEWDRRDGGGRGSKTVYAWGIHYSRRRAFAAEARTRRAAARRPVPGLPGSGGYGSGGYGSGGYGSGGRGSGGRGFGGRGFGYAAGPPPTAEPEAQKIAAVLDGLAATARHDAARAADAAAIGADGVAPVAAAASPPRATWSLPAIGALAASALLLLVVCLL
ncbi:MAG TPA: PH domain-containing protein [Streptosporangiaceae bacterium]|nr:PH domain-containing protein [Streptosporangiaceae bacterium]